MRFHKTGAVLVTFAQLLGAVVFTGLVQPARAETNRSVEKKIAPLYPELARRMHIAGSVKVSAVVAPDGSVTDDKALSGNPMLTAAALEAVRRWKFSSSESASNETVEVDFSAGGN